MIIRQLSPTSIQIMEQEQECYNKDYRSSKDIWVYSRAFPHIYLPPAATATAIALRGDRIERDHEIMYTETASQMMEVLEVLKEFCEHVNVPFKFAKDSQRRVEM